MFKTLYASAILAVGIVTGSANVAKAECGSVTISMMDWSSAIVVTEVASFLMEQGYGCDVTQVPSSTNPAVASLSETGEPDIVTEIWRNSAPALQGLIDEGRVVELTDVLSDGAVEGWFVPTYLVEEHPELGTLDGILKNAALVGARFHNCPEGWGCKTINDNLIAASKLQEAGIEIFNHGSSETLGSSIAAAYEAKEPWFGYYWGPTALLGRYPMVLVDMGTFDEEVHACNKLEDCSDPAVSPYPSAEVLTVVTDGFKERAPEIVALMEKLSFTNAQMNEVLAWQEVNSASGEEAAVHFLTTYPDVWKGWLNETAKQKLSEILK